MSEVRTLMALADVLDKAMVRAKREEQEAYQAHKAGGARDALDSARRKVNTIRERLDRIEEEIYGRIPW